MMKKLFVGALLVLLSLYAGAAASLYFFQEHLLFPRQAGHFSNCPPMQKMGAHEARLGGVRAYEKFPVDAKWSLIFFHGNGGLACEKTWMLEGLEGFPIRIVIVEYPGYAQEDPNDPPPSEKRILAEALSLTAEVKKSSRNVILFGESLGSGVATYVASQIKIDGLILQSPYSSIAAVGQHRYPLFPVRLLSRHPFLAEEWARRVEAPVLVLRAEKDEVIPPYITDEQLKNFPGKVEVVSFQNSTHNSMKGDDPTLYWQSMRGFINQINAQ